jgi:dTDP-L-rhamnose 4-epimerase
MPERILITGGAGFIGSHLVDELLSHGYQVRVLDSLCPQVHGPDRSIPEYLSPEAELIIGDIRDQDALQRSLQGVDAVFHFAAMVGVGQSMYQVQEYVDVNETGTATLLQTLIRLPVERLVVASSMSIYGEGLYVDQEGQVVGQAERVAPAIRKGEWDPRDASGRSLTPVPTPETKPPALVSVYALSKYVQERMCLMIGATYDIPTVALRFFNVYGTRQALSNPYTGVLAIFASRLLNGKPPVIFEDGLQRRDFVHVRDVAMACRLSLDSERAVGLALNIGSGRQVTVLDIASKLAQATGNPSIEPRITGKHRVGDIRHCFSDISLAREVLAFEPGVDLDSGLLELSGWLAGQKAVDLFDTAQGELESRGLTI